MRLQGVILDLDGTLVLSNDAHAHAWAEAFAAYDQAISFAQVRPLIGMGGDQLIPKLAPGLSDKYGVGKQIVERRKQIFAECYASTLKPAPGAPDLLLRLRAAGLTLAVASSSQADELDTLLKAAQVADLIDVTTTSNDADQSKPAPDIVAVALQKLGLHADQVRMLGDTPYDIKAAAGVGIGVIAVRCGGFDDEQLSGALAIYDDPAAVLADYERSPFATIT